MLMHLVLFFLFFFFFLARSKSIERKMQRGWLPVPMIHRDIFSHGSIWKRARFMDVDHARSIDVPNHRPCTRRSWGQKEVFQAWINYPAPIDHALYRYQTIQTTREMSLFRGGFNVDGLLPALKRQDRRPSCIDGSWYPWGGEVLFPLRVSRESRKSRSFFEYFIIGVLVCLFRGCVWSL